MAYIELHCSICPKKPNFSDQSHLLTHLGSKGHLSHYFKTQVRARQDSDIRGELDVYEAWVERNDIEELLSERLKAKDAKTKPIHRSAAITRNSTRKRHTNNKDTAESDSFMRKGVVDPSLEYHPLLPVPVGLGRIPPFTTFGSDGSHAPFARMSTDTEGERSTVLDLWAMQPAPTPRMSEERSSANVLNDLVPILFHAGEGHTELSPTKRDTSPAKPNAIGSHIAGSTDTGTMDNQREDDRYTDASVAESSRLKGIIYPGMYLFDTADEESKKKRNQKKDMSTLLQMRNESEAFEPTEVIYYYPSWDLKKERYISGEVDSTPPSSPEPKTIKVRRKRAPLADLDTNTLRPKKLRAVKARGISPENNLSQADMYDEDRQELLMALGHRHGKSAPSFSVFRDPPVNTAAADKQILAPESAFDSYLMSGDPAHALLSYTTDPYCGRLLSSQPRLPEAAPFFDTDMGMKGTEKYQGVFMMAPPGLDVSRAKSNYSDLDGMSERTDQRYFTMVAHESPRIHSIMPQYMDMKLSYGYQKTGHTSNPLHPYLHDQHQFEQPTHRTKSQTPTVEHHQASRGRLHRASSHLSSGDETIDAGIEDR